MRGQYLYIVLHDFTWVQLFSNVKNIEQHDFQSWNWMKGYTQRSVTPSSVPFLSLSCRSPILLVSVYPLIVSFGTNTYKYSDNLLYILSLVRTVLGGAMDGQWLTVFYLGPQSQNPAWGAGYKTQAPVLTQERPRETADSAVGCRTLFQVVVKQTGKSTYLCVFVNAFIWF